MCDCRIGLSVVLFLLAITPLTINAGCTLQCHAYDWVGVGWNKSTVKITNGDIVLLENWTMGDPHYDMVEFHFEGDKIEIWMSLKPNEEFNIQGRVVISNDQGNPLFIDRVSASNYQTNEEFFHVFNCNLSETTLIGPYLSGYPDAEPECHHGYEDITNAGCRGDVESFSEIQCGETRIGQSGRYRQGELWVLDEDWYRISLETASEIRIHGFTEMPLQLKLFEYLDCETTDPIGELGLLLGDFDYTSYRLPAGQYMIRAVPEHPWTFPCDSNLRYTISVTCNFLSMEGACNTEEESVCEMDFSESFNDICEKTEDMVSELKTCCINSGKTGVYISDGLVISDVDYFSFHLWERAEIPFQIVSSSPINVSLYAGDCMDHTLIDTMIVSPQISETLQVDELEPGDYLLCIEPTIQSGTWCGAEYRVLMDAGIFGNDCNGSDAINTNGLYNSRRYIENTGNTAFAYNNYTATDYGCGHGLETPETVHRVTVPDRMTITATVTSHQEEHWEPRLVITRNWPPLASTVSEYNSADPSTATISKWILEPDEPAFFFIEGEPGQSGQYELIISRIDPAADLMEVELDLNRDHFESGASIQLLGEGRNNTPMYADFHLGLMLEIDGYYWFYTKSGDWSPLPENLPTDYMYLDEEISWTFIDSVWPDTPEQYATGVFTFYLFKYDSDHVPYLISNMVTEEFTF